MMIANRESFAAAARKRLPYDVEVEYLESTGTQWIDTLHHVTNETVINFDAMSTSSETGTKTVLGARQAGDAASVVCYLHDNSAAARWGTEIVNNLAATIGVRHRCMCSKDGYTVDGTNSPFTYSLSGTGIYSLVVFGFTNRGTVSPGKIRLWSLGIKESGIQVRDLIPVRVGNVGYLYDKVSGTLFGNSGTGSFTIGPDKTA